MIAPVYVDQSSRWHINFECESMDGDWSLVELAEVRETARYRACDACGAVYYAETTPIYNAANLPPVTVADTEAPEDAFDISLASYITNGDEIVYVSAQNSHYHRSSTCPSAQGLTFTPVHLIEAILDGRTACTQCSPPVPELTQDIIE